MESTNFVNVNGCGIIKIKTGNIGSYFFIDNPLSVIWSDCAGSTAQYFALTHFSSCHQNLIVNKLDKSIYNDYTNNENLIADFEDLLKLLEQGSYSVIFESPFKMSDWYQSIFLSYNSRTTLSDNFFFKESKENLKISQQSISNFSEWFYDVTYGDGNLLFTRAYETINQERVAFFEKEIKEGKKPFAILLSKSFFSHIGDALESQHSGWFILDGHHKLLAYQNLKIIPPVLKISQKVSKKEYNNFDIKDLENCLMQIQLEHIRINSW